MHTKKDFFRLISVKHEVDSYLLSVFRYWQKENGVEKPPFYKAVSIVGYPTPDSFKLRFDNNEELEYTVPISFFHDKDDTEYAHFLWESDYYDGPISGMAEYKGEKVWFQWSDCTPLAECRIFDFHKLSEEEIAYAEKCHANGEPSNRDNYNENEIVVTLDETFVDWKK